MCHRYIQTASWQQVLELYELPLCAPQPLAFQARYNIAPFQKAPVLRMSNGERRIVSMYWGLTPEFRGPRRKARRAINAEAETLATAYRSAWWLTGAEPPVGLLHTHESSEMIAYPVSRRVNSPTSHGPSLIENVKIPN
jgi:putative SOS response-associated peptidase YedK